MSEGVLLAIWISVAIIVIGGNLCVFALIKGSRGDQPTSTLGQSDPDSGVHDNSYSHTSYPKTAHQKNQH